MFGTSVNDESALRVLSRWCIDAWLKSHIYVGTKGHPLTLSGAQKLPRTEAPPHGVGLPSTSLAIDIDAPIVACQAAGADLSSPKVGIDVLFFWFESHLTLQLSPVFLGWTCPHHGLILRCTASLHGRIIPRFHCFLVKWRWNDGKSLT